MPGKTDLSKLNCSLARTLGAVGDWWALLIVRDAFLGLTRFSEFQRSLGVARNILSARLDSLAKAKILAREGTTTRPRYVLTEKGRAMLPVLVAMTQWGDTWQSKGRPPVLLTDAGGRPIELMQVRNDAGSIVTAGTIRFRPGPGASPDTRKFLKSLPDK